MRYQLLITLNWLVFSSGVCYAQQGTGFPARVFPEFNSNYASPDTPLRLRFPSPRTLGNSGKIQVIDASNNAVVESIDLATTAPTTAPNVSRLSPLLGAPTRVKSVGGLGNYNYYPIIMNGNDAEIYLTPNALAYNKTYWVNVDRGVFKGVGESLEDISLSWKITTRAAGPTAGATKLTVASDGSGDFATVQAALDFIPDGNTTPTTIFLKKGTYTELIYVTNKHGITLLGEDRKQTTIQYATNDRFNGSAGGGGYRRGTLRVNRCNDFVLANLTVRNPTPQGGTQAEAIIFNGTPTSRAIVANVDLYSFQDTLQINGQAYVSNCYIEGDVDFMWGNGPCFFENCTARTVRSGAYYTQIRNPATNHGYVYYKCTFEGAPGIVNNVLSRIAPSQFPKSEVVLIDCKMGPSVSPAAWQLDAVNGRRPAGPTTGAVTSDIHFWEFNSRDMEGKPVDVSQRLAISKQLKQPDDAQTIANYSNPTWVLGNEWDPRQTSIFKTLAQAAKN